MSRQRLGRATFAAMLAAAGIARADLFSPGELARPHQQFEGISNCTKCHPAGDKLSQETCLTPCHTELKPQISAGKGLHGRLSDEKRACETCHHDHKGRDFQMVDWGAGKKSFDHRRTGWALKGAHLKADCEKCHERRLISWPVAIKLLETRPHTFLGVDQSCEACHFDEHRGQQKEDCAYCHNEKEWKPAPGFDHDTANYALKGKHKKVKCEKCHPAQKDDAKHGFPAPKSETFLKLANLEYSACTDCHKDPHENRFGPRCASCHTVDGWHIIRNASKEREFHEKTRYPLKGAHIDVECRDCHGPYPGQAARFKNMKFEDCTDCHPDSHEGQIETKGTKLPDCTLCHSVEGFMPPQYGVRQHAQTKYPLEGAHLAVPCDECHEESPALQKRIPQAVLMDLRRKKRRELFSLALFDFTKPMEKCDSCHTDVHKGQFEKKCDECHVAATFQKVRFDHQKDSRYALTGKHEKVPCEKCHFVPPGSRDQVDGKPVVLYRPMDQKCRACHPDQHVGQFVRKGKPADCEDCHVTDEWKKTKFRHEPPFTSYLLDGQHAKVPCEKCHPKVVLGPKLESVRYTPLPKTCEGCHADYHKGAFQGFEP